MTAPRRFGVTEIDLDDEPFVVTVHHLETGETQEHAFRVRKAVSNGLMIDALTDRTTDPDYLARSIVAEDRARFDALMSDEDWTIGNGTLTEIVKWLVEVQASRPTQSAGRSQRGRQTPGGGSRGDAPSTDSTSGDSPPGED